MTRAAFYRVIFGVPPTAYPRRQLLCILGAILLVGLLYGFVGKTVREGNHRLVRPSCRGPILSRRSAWGWRSGGARSSASDFRSAWSPTAGNRGDEDGQLDADAEDEAGARRAAPAAPAAVPGVRLPDPLPIAPAPSGPALVSRVSRRAGTGRCCQGEGLMGSGDPQDVAGKGLTPCDLPAGQERTPRGSKMGAENTTGLAT